MRVLSKAQLDHTGVQYLENKPWEKMVLLSRHNELSPYQRYKEVINTKFGPTPAELN